MTGDKGSHIGDRRLFARNDGPERMRLLALVDSSDRILSAPSRVGVKVRRVESELILPLSSPQRVSPGSSP